MSRIAFSILILLFALAASSTPVHAEEATDTEKPAAKPVDPALVVKKISFEGGEKHFGRFL